MRQDVLIAGGFGEVGRWLGAYLEVASPGRVVLAGRHPREVAGFRTRFLDVDLPESIDAALKGVAVVVACVRQREPHLLRAAVRHGIGYTSIAPPWIPWPELQALHPEAERTGARIVYAAGLEPGISSVLARIGAEEVGPVDAVETALLLGAGDTYGPDSLEFILDELRQEYTVLVDGTPRRVHAFEDPVEVEFPAPAGRRRAWTMPFCDQLYYPATLGAKTAIARIALDPPWLPRLLAAVTGHGGRRWIGEGGGQHAMHGLAERIRRRYASRDRYALVVEVGGRGGVVRSSLVGRGQAHATAAGASAIAEALHAGEVNVPGIWLAEQAIDPGPFLARLAAHGLVPVIGEVQPQRPPERRTPRALHFTA